MLVFCYHHFWQWSIDLANYFGLDSENEILLSGICMLIMNVIYDTISLPLTVYEKFVVEQKHGFNKEVRKQKFHFRSFIKPFDISMDNVTKTLP